MATWKKIVVSGSAISQLNNDLGYVDSDITASSLITASVAANIITLEKGDGSTFTLTVATGSAESASFAVSASHAEFADEAGNAASADSVAFTNITGKPTLVSGSSQITISQTTGYTTFSSSIATDITSNTTEISSVSSSLATRITAQEDFSSSLDATFATEAELNAATASLSASLATDIATNADNISTNSTNITNNSSSAATALTNLSSSASTSRDALASDIATNTSDIATLNGKTLISGSIFSSPSQGTLRATINGVPTDVDLGLQAADNVEFADALITGDLTVQGTASFQHTEDLDIADRFIRLASGSNANGDGGITVQQDSPTNSEAFAFDNATSRWGVTSSFDPSTNTIVPDAFMTANVTGADNDPTGIAARYQKNGNIFVGNTGDIWIYS